LVRRVLWTVAETDPEPYPREMLKVVLGPVRNRCDDRVNKFVPDDKSKGRVQFRAGSGQGFLRLVEKRIFVAPHSACGEISIRELKRDVVTRPA